MASLRKSPRNASPVNVPNQGLQPSGFDGSLQHERVDAPLLPPESQPQPGTSTFEDPRGTNLGRPGMREQMSQFRTMPPQPKVKLRVKQYDPSKRSYFARNDDLPDGKETPKAKERNDASRKSGAAEKVEDKKPKQQDATERRGSNDGENTPKATTTVKQPQTLPTRPTSARSTPVKVEAFEPSQLRTIVDSAIERAHELGNDGLGRAIWLIYEDSKTDSRTNQLLTVVLQQKQSHDESVEFQGLIKMARKRARNEQRQAKPPPSPAKPKTSVTNDSHAEPSKPKPTTKSPIRRTRQTAARNESALTSATGSHSPTPQAQANGKATATDGKKTDEPPSKRVKRSRSASSTSTLSSTHSLDIDADLEMSDDGDAVHSDSKKANSTQLPKGTALNRGNLKKPYGSLAAPKLGKETAKNEAEDREREAKKRKLTRTVFEDYRVDNSSVRSSPRPRLERIKTDNTFPNLPSAPQSGRGTKRDYEEMHSPASSIQADLLVPPPPEARRTSRSRAATPNVPRTRGTADRGKPRIKESPMKKKNGVVAGIAPRSTRPKDGAAGTEQHTDDEGENVDFCSACGDQGKLLCCDGCTRSFHFKCLDPPAEEDNPPEGRWFCLICSHKRRDTQSRPTRGFLAVLEHDGEKQNPVAFTLPPPIRGYYEGVGTGEDGEYEEVSATKSTRNTRVPGYDEIQKQDNFKLKDSKNQVILCFRCGLSSLGKREIVSCDYCGLHWHLDCLSPPLANPPFRDPQNRAKHRWMCPAHSEPILSAIGLCGRHYKTRRPKNAVVVDSQVQRGFKSNGLVEIELDPSDEEMEMDETPKVYRVTEGNVRLDFIDKLRKDKEDKQKKQAYFNHKARQTANLNAMDQTEQALCARSQVEQNAAEALCELSGHVAGNALEPLQIKGLVAALLKEAPDNVLALLNEQPSLALGTTPPSISPSPLSSNPRTQHDKAAETKQLLLLQELIRQKLSSNGHS